MSTIATSGLRSCATRSASATVATGPRTSAPHDSSSIFKPAPTSQESSTMRIHRPLSSEAREVKQVICRTRIYGRTQTRELLTKPRNGARLSLEALLVQEFARVEE